MLPLEHGEALVRGQLRLLQEVHLAVHVHDHLLQLHLHPLRERRRVHRLDRGALAADFRVVSRRRRANGGDGDGRAGGDEATQEQQRGGPTTAVGVNHCTVVLLRGRCTRAHGAAGACSHSCQVGSLSTAHRLT